MKQIYTALLGFLFMLSFGACNNSSSTPTTPSDYEIHFYMDAACASRATSADVYVDSNFIGTITAGGVGITQSLSAGTHSASARNANGGNWPSHIFTVSVSEDYKFFCN